MKTKFDRVLGVIRELDEMSDYFGVDWNPALATTFMARIGSKSVFDNYLAKIKMVALSDAGVENATLATVVAPTIEGSTTGSLGQVMVKFPVFYYKEIFDGSGRLSGLRFSEYDLPGYRKHEKFTWGNGRSNIYVGAYEASNSGGNVLQSISGVAPLTSIDIATFRSRAVARGTGWHGYDFFTHHLIELLFKLYYARQNSQLALPGYTEASTWNDAYKRNTGRSNTLTTVNGSIDVNLAGVDSGLTGIVTAGNKIANRFLWVENIFGHIWKFTDGCVFDGRVGQPNTAYITANPTLFSSVDANILANYTNLGITLPASDATNYIQDMQSLFLPKTFGGDSATYVTDYFWSYLDHVTLNYLRVVPVGGSLDYGGQAGVAARHANFGLGFASSLFGSRLCFESN